MAWCMTGLRKSIQASEYCPRKEKEAWSCHIHTRSVKTPEPLAELIEGISLPK